MNTHDACNILGVPLGASIEEIKKAFKKQAVQFHPDRNKDEGAEQKFKEINEAFQFLEKYGSATSTNPTHDNYDHGDHLADELRRRMSDLFNTEFVGRTNPFSNTEFANRNPFGTPRQAGVPPIVISAEVPFDMSVLGGRKEVVFERLVKCDSCEDGKMMAQNKTMCQKCGGHGKRKYGNDSKELPCTGCSGTGYQSTTVSCNVCNGKGSSKQSASLNVVVPSGVENGTRLSLKGKGDYISNNNYGNVSVIISVIPDPEMQLNGKDVISVVEISLLEALKGTKKKLRTVRGEKTLSFKPKTKHRDTIRVSGFGVPPNGAHSFLININYPEDVDNIINVLEQNTPEEISDKQE